MPQVVVVTGAGAGVGQATAEEFARQGYDIGLLSRPNRLERTATEFHGVRALPIPTDVADVNAVEPATSNFEEQLGQIDVWVKVAMATVFAPHNCSTGSRA